MAFQFGSFDRALWKVYREHRRESMINVRTTVLEYCSASAYRDTIEDNTTEPMAVR
jgi:hypothetical protein